MPKGENVENQPNATFEGEVVTSALTGGWQRSRL